MLRFGMYESYHKTKCKSCGREVKVTKGLDEYYRYSCICGKKENYGKLPPLEGKRI